MERHILRANRRDEMADRREQNAKAENLQRLPAAGQDRPGRRSGQKTGIDGHQFRDDHDQSVKRHQPERRQVVFVDRPQLAQETVRAAVRAAARLVPALPAFAGGKSFGGRMTSQAQAKAPLAGVVGLVFFGFPLHAAGKPSSERGDHLNELKIPLLFLQGTNDKLAALYLLKPVVKKLGSRATLHLVEAADHSFHVPARSGRKYAEVMTEVLDAFVAWISAIKSK